MDVRGSILHKHFLRTVRYIALVESKIKVGTTGNPVVPRPNFFIKTWSYMSGELRECSNFNNILAKNCRNLDFLDQSGL